MNIAYGHESDKKDFYINKLHYGRFIGGARNWSWDGRIEAQRVENGGRIMMAGTKSGVLKEEATSPPARGLSGGALKAPPTGSGGTPTVNAFGA